MRIVIFSDSLGRPRPDIDVGEKTEYEDTYPYRLKRHFSRHEVDVVYIDSLDSDDAVYWNERMVCFRRPDFVLYHFGLVDCVPRIFRKGTRSIVFSPWFKAITRNLLLRVIHKYRRYLILTLCRNKVYVPLPRFRQNVAKMISQLKEYAPSVQFLALGISSKPSWYDRRSPGINRNIERYNAVLREQFGSSFVDVDRAIGLPPESMLISDGVHFRKETHERVFTHLKDRIEGLLPSINEGFDETARSPRV